MAVFADLHVHTTNSDGQLTLSTLPAAADAADVSVVAITDHDRFNPDLQTPVAVVDGLTVVHGIELRVQPDDGEEPVDLLGYGLRRTSALARELDRLEADRSERGAAIIDEVEDRLGIELDIEPHEGIGRVHIARAIEAHPESGYDVEGAFEHLIGDGGPCYVARDLPSFDYARELLDEACGLVGLAHPYRYADVERALELTNQLGAVEQHYPYSQEVDPRPLERAIEKYDLVPTGGSDAHEETLGVAGLSQAEYRRFRSAVTL